MSEDGSRSAIKGIKNEWALFWESIAGEEPKEASSAQELENGRLEILSLEKLHEIIRSLSQDRRRVNQKIESLNKEMELNSAKLESLRLVGSPDDDTLKRINELNDIGQILSEQLTKLDEKIKWTRLKQEEFLIES